MTPCSCPCCTKCWAVAPGKCLYGGPYLGYVEIKEPILASPTGADEIHGEDSEIKVLGPEIVAGVSAEI